MQRIGADVAHMLNEIYAEKVLLESSKDYDLAKARYVYFSMHKEPEMALNQCCPSLHNQSQLIRWVAANLPEGVDLVVKEHRFNHGRRHPNFYKALSQLPNVILLDGFSNQFDLIRNSNLVLAINGSAGFEAMIFERPLIYLAPLFILLKNQFRPVNG